MGSVPKPKLRITCCLCAKPIPARADVYLLDDEWARRYPRMRGRIACSHCSLGGPFWDCEDARGNYARGHVPIPDRRADKPCDAWDHIAGHGTQAWAVRAAPESGVIQGAENHLRWIVWRWGKADPEAAERVVRAFMGERSTPGPMPD